MSELTLIERLRTQAKTAAPPVTADRVEAAESRLRVRLPALLKQIYLEIGSGGFGPGDGLTGLPAPSTPALSAHLYPLCDWGSGISSALDCARPEAPVIRIDPNMAKADVPVRVPPALHFDRAAEVKDACWVESPSLEEWLTDWLDGQPLFYAAYRGADTEDDDEEYEDEDDLEEA